MISRSERSSPPLPCVATAQALRLTLMPTAGLRRTACAEIRVSEMPERNQVDSGNADRPTRCSDSWMSGRRGAMREQTADRGVADAAPACPDSDEESRDPERPV